MFDLGGKDSMMKKYDPPKKMDLNWELQLRFI